MTFVDLKQDKKTVNNRWLINKFGEITKYLWNVRVEEM